MANDPFVEVTTHNLSAFNVIVRIARDPSKHHDLVPMLQPNGSYMVTAVPPDNDDGHLALGRFLDSWSRLEQQIARCLAGALKIEWQQATALMNGLGNRGQTEAIRSLLMPQLDETPAIALEKLLVRIQGKNTQRNHLIHGYWYLEIIVKDRNGLPFANVRQYRRYDPSDTKIIKDLDARTCAKARKNYLFSVGRINAISTELTRLRSDLAAFINREVKNAPDQEVTFKVD